MLTELKLASNSTTTTVVAKESEEEIKAEEFSEATLKVAENLETAMTKETPLEPEWFVGNANDWLRGMQLAWARLNNNRIKQGKVKADPFSCRPLIKKLGGELSQHVLAFLEWVAVVRVAALDYDAVDGMKAKIAMQGRAAIQYQLRFDCLTTDSQIVRESVPVWVLEPYKRQFQLRQYVTGIVDGRLTVGGAENCTFAKDVWKSPGLKSGRELTYQLNKRGKSADTITRAIAAMLAEQAAANLPMGVYPELGAALSIENIDTIRSALTLVEALIASVVVDRKTAHLVAIARRTSFTPSDIIALCGDNVGTEGDVEEDVRRYEKLAEELGPHIEEAQAHVQQLQDAQSRQRLVTPFAVAEPCVAFTASCPDTVKKSSTRKLAGRNDVWLLSGTQLSARSDRGLLLRHPGLTRDRDARTDTLVPRVLLDFAPVIDVAGCLDNGTYKLLPQVCEVTLRPQDRGVLPLSVLDYETAGAAVRLSREATRWGTGEKSKAEKATT